MPGENFSFRSHSTIFFAYRKKNNKMRSRVAYAHNRRVVCRLVIAFLLRDGAEGRGEVYRSLLIYDNLA